jgi:hypothetical protein
MLFLWHPVNTCNCMFDLSFLLPPTKLPWPCLTVMPSYFPVVIFTNSSDLVRVATVNLNWHQTHVTLCSFVYEIWCSSLHHFIYSFMILKELFLFLFCSIFISISFSKVLVSLLIIFIDILLIFILACSIVKARNKVNPPWNFVPTVCILVVTYFMDRYGLFLPSGMLTFYSKRLLHLPILVKKIYYDIFEKMIRILQNIYDQVVFTVNSFWISIKLICIDCNGLVWINVEYVWESSVIINFPRKVRCCMSCMVITRSGFLQSTQVEMLVYVMGCDIL